MRFKKSIQTTIRIFLASLLVLGIFLVIGCEQSTPDRMLVSHKPSIDSGGISQVKIAMEPESTGNVTEEIENVELVDVDTVSEAMSEVEIAVEPEVMDDIVEGINTPEIAFDNNGFLIFIDDFNESEYESISLNQVEESKSYPDTTSFDEYFLNRTIYFTGSVYPAPLFDRMAKSTGIIIGDGVESLFLSASNHFMSSEYLELKCAVSDLKIIDCTELEAFGEYRFYGLLNYTSGFIIASDEFQHKHVELVIHAVKKLDDPDVELASFKPHDCSSDADCGWVSANCCSSWAGADWVCLNKDTQEYLCDYGRHYETCADNMVPDCIPRYSKYALGNEAERPKPTGDCTCQEGMCVAE